MNEHRMSVYGPDTEILASLEEVTLDGQVGRCAEGQMNRWVERQ